MISSDTKLVQIQNPISPKIDLTTEVGRFALAQQIKADIDEYCQLAYNDGPRSHLGASEIGHKCERFLWYKFRWCGHEEFSGRMLRLFNRGHKEEERFIEWLTGIQCEVIQVEEDGKQARMVAVAGHFGGSCDGRGLFKRYGINEPFLLEFKTGSQVAHKKLVEGGVTYAKPLHWSQMCTYGVGFKLRYAVYISISKNDDDLHIEVLELDHKLGEEMLSRAQRIVSSPIPPPRLSENASYYECKYCPLMKVCHFGEAPERNCRSCKNASPADNGQWNCSQFGEIPKEYIPRGCDNWTPITEQ